MIEQLVLKNFRKHKELTINFGTGLNAVMGSNEQGKSTVIEGILYALFGAKALRTTLADTVTWGLAESKLSALLTITVEGETYLFKRSKGGAEIIRKGSVFITGQTEVTNYAAQLLGVDAVTASKLMLASQNGLRGSLEQGAKATSAMIEGLADFDLFDRLLERMGEKLLLGAPALLEQRVAQTEQDHANLGHVDAPDVSHFAKQESEAKETVSLLETSLTMTLIPAEAAAKVAYDAATMARLEYSHLETRISGAETDLRNTNTRLAEAQAGVSPIDMTELDRLKETLQNEAQRVTDAATYSQMVQLMKGYPESFWEGTKEELDTDILAAAVKVDEITASIAKTTADIRVWKTQKVGTTCPTCKQAIAANLNEIMKRNAELDELTLSGAASLAMWETALSEAKGDLRDLKAVLASAAPFTNFAAKHFAHVETDLNFVPVKITWKGVPPPPAADVAGLKTSIAVIENRHILIRQNQARVEVLTETVNSLNGLLMTLRGTLTTMPTGDNADDLMTESVLAAGASAEARIKITELKNAAEYYAARASEVVEEYKAFLASKATLLDSWAKAKADLAKLHFNNNLLKKVRAARPVIADQLWSAVLMAVSTMFSQMRGEASVVTKDKDGFKVNGQAVESLSGSTLDLLGLAIRVALIKTFLPTCPFVILDEPAHGCDDDRTTSLLGFLSGAGFQQTIIVTHDDTSEAVADSLITL